MTPIHLITEYYAAEMPGSAKYYRIDGVPNGEFYELIFYKDGDDIDFPDEIEEVKIIDLPPGNWQIICTTKECLKKVPMGIVECKTVEYDGQVQGTRFVNYLNDNQRYWFINKTESLRSLLTSKGLDPVKNYILIKKLK